MPYDVVIIGSGLGGLACGVMLSREGMRVCVVEQAAHVGGCLQSFVRGGRSIDTGIHYVGSMDEGQILRQYFRYFGIDGRFGVSPLDDAFDIVRLEGVGDYAYHRGYKAFYEALARQFPAERGGLRRYCDRLYEIGSSVSVEVHREGRISAGGLEYLGVSAADFIDSCVADPVLRQVLAGTNVLYGAERASANLYHHAMINHSNIEGASRIAGGTQQVADALVAQIRAHGGEVRTNSRVVAIRTAGSAAQSVELASGERIEARRFVADLHPSQVLALVGDHPAFRRGYRERMQQAENTPALMAAYLGMKPNSFPYLNSNYYYYTSTDVWQTLCRDRQPRCVMLNTQLPALGARTSDVVTLLTPIRSADFVAWSDTSQGRRGGDYEAMKREIADRMIAVVSRAHPGLRDRIESIETASPLTYRDYTSTPDGSAYGLLKDCRNPVATLLPVRTKIENLLLTGQNVNAHGALGVVLTAAKTCAEWLGEESLARKIGNC